jgi:hypothetical protein
MIRKFKQSGIAIATFILIFGFLSQASADEYDISIEPIGHWHVFDSKMLTIHVTDPSDNSGIAGLDLLVQFTRVGSESVTERSVSGDRVIDMGDGTYTVEYEPSTIGAYALLARFTVDEREYASSPVPFEVAKAGEEGILAVADGTPFVYQIRYVWEPGHIHASDDHGAVLSFEIMRGVETGDAINWAQPWSNTFDHVTEVETARVELVSADGTVVETLLPNYQGRGIYEADRLFTVAEVGDGRGYMVQFTFTDAMNMAEVTHAEPFHLQAVPSH